MRETLTDKIENLLKLGGIKKDICLIIIAGIALIISLFNLIPLPFNAAWIAIILCGVPIIMEAAIGLVTRFDIKADVLVSIALIASILIGEYFAAGEVALIMQVGKLLEDMTTAKAKAGIEKLVQLTPQTAHRILGSDDEVVPVDEIHVGDIVRVFPGETVPLDGNIISGTTSIDQAVVTGESLPVDKSPGDVVFSGTVNQFGIFDIKVTKSNEDSSIQKMVELVQSANAGKAKIVGIADRWATWIVVMALTAAALTWLVTGEILRAVTILVVFCPCALVLATPTAITAAIGNATKHGFLIKEGDALERLSVVSKIAFDKTGTLTYGKPKVMAVHSYTLSQEDLFHYAASIESNSEHPLGKAVVSSYDGSKELMHIDDFHIIPGKGVKGVIEKKTILAGNMDFLSEEGIDVSGNDASNAEKYMSNGCSIIYISVDGELSGFIVLSDTVRHDTKIVISEVKEAGVDPVLITGDYKAVAKHIASQISIEEVFAECLPEDKVKQIDTYQKNSQNVCMIGDGVNDAPALKKAHVSIAMGKIGSGIAIDAADIALVDDNIRELPHLLHLSKRAMKTIRCNLAFSLIFNFIAIAFAISGMLSPVLGALVHNIGSVIVVISSALLIRWKRKPVKLDYGAGNEREKFSDIFNHSKYEKT